MHIFCCFFEKIRVMIKPVLLIMKDNILSNQLDPKTISKLAEILDKNNLTELEYEDEGCRICLTRESGRTVMPAVAPGTPIMTSVTPSVIAPAVPEAAPAEDDYTSHAGAVKSPMVGVVYLSADPNSPEYVKIGSSVAEGDTVCLIEAMKTFNPVKAHRGGKVTKVLVTSGDPVEYGEPLIIIE